KAYKALEDENDTVKEQLKQRKESLEDANTQVRERERQLQTAHQVSGLVNLAQVLCVGCLIPVLGALLLLLLAQPLLPPPLKYPSSCMLVCGLLAAAALPVVLPYRTIHRGTLCECNHFNNYWFSVVTAIQRYAEVERTGGLLDARRVLAVEEQLPVTCEVGCPAGWFLMVVDDGEWTYHERGPSMVYDMEMVPLNISNPSQLSELLLDVLEAGRSQFWPLVWLSKFCLPGQAALMALCAWKRALEGDSEGVLNYMAMGTELIQYGMSCMLEHSREDLPLNATVLSDVLQGRVPLSLQGIVIDPVQGEKYADTAYRACIPLQVEGCWPWIAWTTHESCEMYTVSLCAVPSAVWHYRCCDPDIEEKPTACGRDLRRCCNLGEEARVQQPTCEVNRFTVRWEVSVLISADSAAARHRAP
ncbi:hypothetical protein FOZ62_028210, partial [Perkinsus olseni]